MTTVNSCMGNRPTTSSFTHLDLLVGGNGAEDDLGEALSGKHAEADPADDSPVLDQGHALVLPAHGGESGGVL